MTPDAVRIHRVLPVHQPWGRLEPQHFTLSESGEMRVLNLGLVYLIADLQRGLELFVEAAARDSAIQANMVRSERNLCNQTLRL